MTQAQIEAAAKVLDVSYTNRKYAMKMAERVLTAAAEAGDKTKTQEAYEAGLEDGRAAAEAPTEWPDYHGLGRPATGLTGQTVSGNDFVREITNAAIERCAQKIEELLNDGVTKEYLAAAIRALKEDH